MPLQNTEHENEFFEDEFWYPGQQLKGLLGSLETAVWLKTTMLHNPSNIKSKRNANVYAVVEEVKTDRMEVNWVCRGFSKLGAKDEGKISQPPKDIYGDDLKRWGY